MAEPPMTQKEFDQYIKRLKRQSEQHPDVIVEKLKQQKFKKEFPLQQSRQRLEEMSATMQLWNATKPWIVWGLIILFIIGPGVSVIFAIMQSFPWYIWVGLLILTLYIWRSY